MHVVPQLLVVALSAFLYFQYARFRTSGAWTKSSITFQKFHVPILAFFATVDIALCIASKWMAIPAVLTGIAITLIINR